MAAEPAVKESDRAPSADLLFDASDMRAHESQTRVPTWGHPLIVAGGGLTYFVVGQVLHSPDFLNDLQLLLAAPGTLAAAGPERIAPLVLLLIPAILGGFGTRAMLVRVLEGMARRESPRAIVVAIGGLLLSGLVYVLLALFSSGRKGL